MLLQVKTEGIAFPSAHGLYDVEWYASEEVFKGASDAEAVPLEVWEVVGDSDDFYAFDDFALGEWSECFFTTGFVSEYVSVWGRRVDVLMIFEGFPRVRWAWLLGPGCELAFLPGRFGEG